MTDDAPGNGNVDWNCALPNTEAQIENDINFDRTCVGAGQNQVLATTTGGDDLRQGGVLAAGPDGRLDSLVVATGLGANDVVVGAQIQVHRCYTPLKFGCVQLAIQAPNRTRPRPDGVGGSLQATRRV